MRKITVVILVLLIVLPPPARAQAEALPVYYAGPQGEGVHTALRLAQDKGFVKLVLEPGKAQVFVLNGIAPGAGEIARRVQAGAGLVLVLGPGLEAGQVETLLGTPVSLEAHSEPLSLVQAEGESEPGLLGQIDWKSAPQVRERFSLVAPLPDIRPLVVGYGDSSLILGSGQRGRGKTFVLTPFLGGKNPQFQSWAYFNYLFYALVTLAAGAEGSNRLLPFAGYPASPVPHAAERTALLAAMALLLAICASAFVLVHRFSQAHPELLEDLVEDREKFERREEGTRWEEAGFHRPLGGFLLALMVGLVLFIPLILYQNLVLPVFILPSAQALGIWGRVTQFFELAWQFFDMGTSTAFIKYLSQHRVRDPRRGIQFGQLFVWWQVLSGAVQVALVILIASTIVPRSPYALYAWSIIIHAFIQLPGFYEVMRHALTGWQRFDYAQILDIGFNVFLPILIQPVFVLIMYAWGKANPVFGAAMGGLLGLGIAAYATALVNFLIGLRLYRRIGYNARLLFLAHFDWNTVRAGFRFGGLEMLGSVAWTVGQAAEIWITQARLINYAEIWGNWGLAKNFIFAFNVNSTLFNNLMPSISESISRGWKKLSQYYATQAYRYGGMISAFICSVLLAVADRFILGASGVEFTRAASYAIPLILWGAIQYPSWVADNIQLASNRPELKSSLIFGEQLIRVVLALVLLERLQINALIVSYFVALLAKDIAAYFINHRLCFPQRFYGWSSLVAPALAGGANYLLLRGLTGLIWQGDQVTSVLIFFIGILLSYPVFMLFYGLFGGWDDAALDELRQSVALSGLARPLAWLFWASTALGARLSPLHDRFPIDIRRAAQEEAAALTRERIRLVAPDDSRPPIGYR